MTVSIDFPVGLRWRTQNVKNLARDQRKIIELLAAIPEASGGKKESWSVPPLSGPDGSCPRLLGDAIWDFQTYWRKRGAFAVVDGVVDPGKHSIAQLNALASGRREHALPDEPSRRVIVSPPRIVGSWQITNMWSVTLGEAGLVGAVEMEVTQPDGKKFVMTGAGAGFGVGLDPLAALKLLKPAAKGLGALSRLEEVMKMLGTGVVFNIGDYLQKLGVPLSQVTAGRIIPNPLNEYFNEYLGGYLGGPTAVTRHILAGGNPPPPFEIISVGGSVFAGGEGGIVAFRQELGHLPPAFAIYGSLGLTIKVGVGVQGMLYYTAKVTNA